MSLRLTCERINGDDDDDVLHAPLVDFVICTIYTTIFVYTP